MAKQGVEIYPTHFPLARSYQTSLGVQRDLGHGMVVTADWARRQAENYSLGEQDLNHYNLAPGPTTAGGPVIPKCATSQLFVPGQECSTGPITFWTDQGRAVYDGLLVKVASAWNTAISSRLLMRSKRAWTRILWTCGELDVQLRRVSAASKPEHRRTGAVAMGLRVQHQFIDHQPESGDGVRPRPGSSRYGPYRQYEPLPGLAFNCLNAGCGKTELANAVNAYNQANPNSQLALPSNYALSAPVFSQDIRLTKTFVVKERYRFTVLAEMFNALNISNLTIGTYQLDTKNVLNPAGQTYSFGQPTGRVTQTFGSGGPRALQVGARFTF